MVRFFLTLALIFLVIGAFYYLSTHIAPQKLAQTSQNVLSEATGSAQLGNRTKTADCHVNGPYPDMSCTPGSVFEGVTADKVCQTGYSKSVRNVSAATKRKVYDEYGIATHKPGEYEIDHLISLELGGSNSIANLFPEAAEPRPGFHEKDMVENYLHYQVCHGQVSMQKAQQEIATDWLSVYKSVPNIQNYDYSNWGNGGEK